MTKNLNPNNEFISHNIGSRRLQPAREKKHRLPLNCYKGFVTAAFTLCIKGNKPLFTNEIIISEFLDILVETKNKYKCKNWVYVFMPDHLHFILEGTSDSSDLWKAVVLFKQKTGFWLSNNNINIKWEKDFYDHIFRKDNDLKKHILYILNNPIRKQLATDWKDYHEKGSLDYNLNEIIN